MSAAQSLRGRFAGRLLFLARLQERKQGEKAFHVLGRDKKMKGGRMVG